MRIIATTTIEGPEAKGNAAIIVLENTTYQLQLTNFWVAFGAPDVRIVLSEDPNGVISEHNIRFIANLPSGNFNQNFPIEHLDDLNEMKTIIVYCKQFCAHFGHGTIKWNI